MLTYGLLFASLFALCMGNPARRSLRIHENRPTIPTGFSRVGPADSDIVLSLRLGLMSSGVDQLIETTGEERETVEGIKEEKGVKFEFGILERIL